MDGKSRFCVILAIDIEGFGSPARSDLTRAWLRHRLRQFVNDALVGADVKQGQVLLHSDLGDGLRGIVKSCGSPVLA